MRKDTQALFRFSVLQVTESWEGPGNEATTKDLTYLVAIVPVLVN